MAMWMKEFFTNFSDKAIAATVIAALTILLVGCLKLIPKIKNVANTELRKFIFEVFSLAISAGLSIGYYLLIAKGGWDWDMLAFIGVVLGEIKVLYPLYENYGARFVLRKVGSLLVPSKKKEVEAVADKIADTVETLTSDEVAKKQEKAEKTGWLE